MFKEIGTFIMRAGISVGSCYVIYKTMQLLDEIYDEGDQSCRTIKQSKIYTNLWTIENFDTMKGTFDMKSTVFSGTTLDGVLVKWRYRLTQRENGITVDIQCESKETSNQRVEISFTVGSSGSKKYSGIIGAAQFAMGPRYHVLERCNYWTGSLKLRFEVTFIRHILKGDTSGNLQALPEAPSSKMAENFSDLLQNEQFTDVAIKVGSETLRAHKAILAARSTVFGAMFQHDMQESRCNEITIKDMEPRVFREVLRFIYTDKVEGMEQIACELLAAADRYDLDRLKALSEIELCSGITAKTAANTLVFADMHKADALKARALQYIISNLKAIPNWKEVCSANPDLVAEILDEIAKGNNGTEVPADDLDTPIVHL